MDSDIYDRLTDQLREVERKWRPMSGGGIQTTTGGGNGLTSGIVSAMSGGFSSIQRAMSELHSVARLRNVLNAIDESFPAAFNEITRKLRGISIDSIKPILRDMLTDVALYLGGSTALGAGIGGGIGALAGGVGAIPGAMVGGWLGFEIGNVIMALTGLKSVVVFMKDAVPAAISCYGAGFKKAWGEPTDTAPWKFSASGDFARGHILFMMALLMGIVAYLTRGKGDFGALLTEMRASKKLGPKMAQWLEANKNDLLKNPELQPKASAGGGGAEPPAMASQAQGPRRGASTGPQEPESPVPTSSSGKWSGRKTPIPPLADDATRRSLIRENEAADILVQNGYNVEQNPTLPGLKNPDYLVNGEVFDCYSPETSNVRNIWSTVSGKVEDEQAPNIVVNLADSNASVDALKTQFAKYPVDGLGKLIVIDKTGSAIPIVGQ